MEVEVEKEHVGFLVRKKRFAWLLQNHHGDGRVSLNCKAEPGENEARAASDPERYFIPAYLGARGWIGFWLDTPKVDWAEVGELLMDAYRLTAPKRLAALIENPH